MYVWKDSIGAVRGNGWARVIVHIDMDAFFAQIEERDNPGLRGKPVVVGGMPGSRGVASTCNYRAREYGVHAGMPLAECQRLCPGAHFVRTNGRKYSYVSLQVLGTLKMHSDRVEMASIDEAYLDMTKHRLRFSDLQEMGETIKRDIYRRVQLTCSVGIAPNRYVAKMCAGENKPNGLTIMDVSEYREVFAPRRVSALIGVGESTERALNSMGIKYIYQLQDFPEDLLKARFGVFGPRLKQMANGDYEHSLATPYTIQPEDKSAGHETTFSRDVSDLKKLHSTLLHLSSKVARRLRENNYQGKRITIKIRYSDFTTVTHQTTLNYFSNDEVIIYKEARRCFMEAYSAGRAVRLIGVRLSMLRRTIDTYSTYQNDLFKDSLDAKRHLVLRAADRIRDKFGEAAIFYVGTMERG